MKTVKTFNDFLNNDTSKKESTTNEGFGDEYSTKNVRREDLTKLIDMLDAADISYDLDNKKQTIEFDVTELNRQQQAQVEKLLDKWIIKESETNESAIEYVDKDAPESKIAVRGFGNYITLMQTDFDDKKTTTFVVGTNQIPELIKVLNKFK